MPGWGRNVPRRKRCASGRVRCNVHCTGCIRVLSQQAPCAWNGCERQRGRQGQQVECASHEGLHGAHFPQRQQLHIDPSQPERRSGVASHIRFNRVRTTRQASRYACLRRGRSMQRRCSRERTAPQVGIETGSPSYGRRRPDEAEPGEDRVGPEPARVRPIQVHGAYRFHAHAGRNVTRSCIGSTTSPRPEPI